ncbi:FkbM family methyltransferase [Gammaproteobacteria bacterium]|nr:FkbM family methyltransferase [Gammaproteobacteria bacterium]
MTDLSINVNPPMSNFLIKNGVFSESPFTFLDVGVSGGIESHWRHFGDQLLAFGFDPWIEECERLSKIENLANVKYIPNWVGIVDKTHWIHDNTASNNDQEHPINKSYYDYYGRASYLKALEYLEPNDKDQFLHSDANIVNSKTLSQDKIQLESFVKDEKINTVDFIKIDTDGADFEALLGCEDILESHGVLGFCIESQMHGTFDERSNTFSNMSKYLESKGFFLYDLSIHKYSKAALPDKFSISIPAQTLSGQVVWGDVLYLRDPLLANYSNVWQLDFTTEKLLKLACIYEIYGMPDCAAELIVKYRKQIDKLTDSSVLLDKLTPLLNNEKIGYVKFLEHFKNNPHGFFDEPHKVPYADMPDKFSLNEKCKILEEQKDVLIREVALKDVLIKEQGISIQRLQDLHTNILRAQLKNDGKH